MRPGVVALNCYSGQDAPMVEPLVDVFSSVCALTSGVINHSLVAEHRLALSVLSVLSVGGVAAHLYSAIRRFEIALDLPFEANPAIVNLSEFCSLNRMDGPGDGRRERQLMLQQDAEAQAVREPVSIATRYDQVVGRLMARLPDEKAQRLVPVWTIANRATIFVLW